jgi:DNA-binding PadR family transcriptional regulator
MEKSSYVGPRSPEPALLGLLSQKPSHGYELHQRLVGDLGLVWHVSQSQTYNILSRLESEGKISGTTQEQHNRPSRRVYQLTKQGRERFEDWLHTPNQCSVRAVRVEFITRLYFARSRDSILAQRLIDEQAVEIKRGLKKMQRRLSELNPDQLFNRLGLELRISQLQSLSSWLEVCRQELEKSPAIQP